MSVGDGNSSSSFRRLDPLRGGEWDRIVSEHPSASVFHTSNWAKVLSNTYGFRPRYYIREASADRTEAFCFMQVSSWLTGKRAISLPFTDCCEPLTFESEFQTIVDVARELGKAENLRRIEFRGISLDLPSNSETIFLQHSLQLNSDPDHLFNNFDSGVRRAIRKAASSGVQVTIERSFESVCQFFTLHCITRRKYGVPPPPFAFFQNIHTHLIAAGLGFVALAKRGGEVLAGAVFLHFANKAEYKFSASSGKFDSLRPNNAVMWAAIQYLQSVGCESLRFGRTERSNEGLRRYKLGWGSKELALPYLNISPLTGEYLSSTDLTRGFHTAIFQKLPPFLLRQMGAVLYRHIA